MFELNSLIKKQEKVNNARAIRLFYVAMEKFKRYSTNEICVGRTYGISSQFNLPEKMTIEDANKVVSYLTEKVEKEQNLLPFSEKGVASVSNALEDYGFNRVEGVIHGHYHEIVKFDPFSRIRTQLPVCQIVDGVVDLFTVSGDVRLFERSDLNSRYFDWYTPKLSRDEIENIYKSIGREDIIENMQSEQGEIE